MAIEFSMANEVEKVVEVPFSALDDHYRREGYKVIGVELGYKKLDEKTRNPPEPFFRTYPNARIVQNPNTRNFHWEDWDQPMGIRIRLEPIPKEENK